MSNEVFIFAGGGDGTDTCGVAILEICLSALTTEFAHDKRCICSKRKSIQIFGQLFHAIFGVFDFDRSNKESKRKKIVEFSVLPFYFHTLPIHPIPAFRRCHCKQPPLAEYFDNKSTIETITTVSITIDFNR